MNMKMQLPYRHTQIGWVILASLLLPVGIVVPVAVTSVSVVPLVIAVVLVAVTTLLFGTLSIRVDEQSLCLRFGVGLIQKRVPISTIGGYQEVENPWYYGWGIHRYPGGVLYNVAGRSAIELVLSDGQRVRIGTDEPAKLFLVLESLLGASRPLDELPSCQGIQGRRRPWAPLLVVGIVGVFVVGLAALLHVQAKPPVVTLDDHSLCVDNLFYGQSVNYADIRRLELLDSIPPIRARTNGYAANGTLRGWFLLERLGSGKLFIQWGHPPYLAIYLQEGFIILNYEDAEATRQIYAAARGKIDLTR